MARSLERPPRRRPRLTRERVLRAALKLADERGIEAVSMRNLGAALRVEAMSLYKQVHGKEDVLDGIADLVMAEYEIPEPGGDWRAELRRASTSAYAALRRHPWAGTVIESRLAPGAARLRYLDAVVGVLRGAGFAMPQVAHAFMTIDSYIYGFTLQELALPFDSSNYAEVADGFAANPVLDSYANLRAMAELAVASPGPESMGIDFQFGLDLILDGLDRLPRG